MKFLTQIFRGLTPRVLAVSLLATGFLSAVSGLRAQPVVKTLTGDWCQYNTVTFYGNQITPSGDNTFEQAQFNYPCGLALDPAGTTLFVADYTNNAVRKIINVGNTNTSLTTTFVSTNKGISRPVAVVMDGATNLYVLNRGINGNNGTVIKFDSRGHSLATNAVNLTNATAMAMDGLTNLYITVKSNTVIQITPAGGISVVGVITNAGTSLRGIAVLDNGNLALTDAGNNGIWVMTPFGSISNNATKLTGFNGAGDVCDFAAYAAFNRPEMIAKADGNMLVVADRGNHKVKLVDAAGTVTRLFGMSSNLWYTGPGSPGFPVFPGWYDSLPDYPVDLQWDGITPPALDPVEAREPLGILVGPDGSVYDTEVFYHIIRKITVTGLTATNAPGRLPLFSGPAGIALNLSGTELFIADPTNNTISVLNLANNRTSVFLNSTNGIYQPVDVALDNSDNLYVLNQGTGGNGSILEFDKYGNFLRTNAAALSLPTAMKLSFAGNLYVAELTGAVQIFYAGGSNAVLATVNNTTNVQLQGVTLLDNGSVVVSDAGNQVLWKISPPATNAVLFTGVVGTPGANFGAVGNAKLNTPLRLAQAQGGLLLIADSGNNRVVVCDDSGTISSALISTNATLWFGNPSDPVSAGSPNYVPMLNPTGLAIHSNGTVFVSEPINKDIRGLLNTGILAPIAPPPAPLNLVATATYGQVGLTWSAATGATNYNVKRSTSSGGPYTPIGSTSSTSYTDTSVLNGSTYYYVVSAVNGGGESPNSAEVSATVPWPPVPDPQIGYVDFPDTSTPIQFTSVFHPFSAYTFYNDANLVIKGTPGTSTYYTYDGTIPTTNSPSVLSDYQDGLPSPAQLAPYLIPQVAPTLTIMAMGAQTNRPSSAVVQATIQFITGNPSIMGNNAAQFFISDITANAHLYYTLDGSNPSSTNGVDLGTVATVSNLWTVGFSCVTNTTFKVRATRPNYQDSAVVSAMFSPSNFTANVISFGFSSGEASSDFVGSPGQSFYAPVTLSVLPAATMYSLQFNLTATNLTGPAVTPGAIGFKSFLEEPIPNTTPVLYEHIPPAMFVGYDSDPPPANLLFTFNGITNFVWLLNTNSTENLLGVGWLERWGTTNLYNTLSQDLITYSRAHDVQFHSAGGKVEVGSFAFIIPPGATNGAQYQIQIDRTSATSDGVGAPGSDVYIAQPTNGSLAAGALNSIKVVTVGQRKYLVGDVYPFRWFNAGDFGQKNLVNADVMQVFQYACYHLDYVCDGSDFFDAMDSCGGTYVDLGHGYLEYNSAISGAGALNPLFNGNDTSINQIAFGDGVLDVCDVYVTFRRSLDPSLTWFERYWTNGVRAAQIVTNTGTSPTTLLVTKPAASKPVPLGLIKSSTSPAVTFTAGDITNATAGQTVYIPINAQIFGSYPLRVLMLNLTVEPLDGSPAITTPVQFTPNAALGSPYTSSQQGANNYGAVWLDSTIAGLSGTAVVGTLQVTLPTNAPAGAAYAVRFNHASGSPNGIASFPRKTFHGLITLSDRSASSYNDGIPDSWRLRWFGTIYNALSASNADACGDGINNWKKYIAGTDPTDPKAYPSLNPKTPVPSGSTTAIHWPTVSGKQYVIESSASLFSGGWTAIATNTGTGTDMEFDDNNGGRTLFYRVRILP